MPEGKTSEERIQNILDLFGVEVLNQTIKRHQLSNEKRDWFVIRLAESRSDDPDPQKEQEYTRKMDELTIEIKKIDEKLYRKGIEDDSRKSILRDIKKVYPNQWQQGFVVD